MSRTKKNGPPEPDSASDAFGEDEPPTDVVRIDVRQPVTHHRPARLRFVKGVASGRCVEWSFDRLVLGRADSADLCVQDPSLCDWHVAFERKLSIAFCVILDDHALLELNGVKVRSCALADGDRLRLGETVIEYVDGS